MNTRRRRSRDSSAVVTGAASGIGQAFAVELAARGGQVICSDIDLVGAGRTAAAINDQGGRATAVACDVSSLDDVARLAEAAGEWFEGPPTLIVNNAGVGAGGSVVGDVAIDDWRWTLGVNLWGPIHGCHVFAPILRTAGYGGIINVASAASFGAAPRMAAYNVSKAGVLSLSETLAAELAGTGVRVSVLCPTFVKTNIIAAGRIDHRSSAAAETLMRITGLSPQRVARNCLDTHDRGGLYVVPNLDAKIGWEIKRHLPRTYTTALGLVERWGPLGDRGVSPPITETDTRISPSASTQGA